MIITKDEFLEMGFNADAKYQGLIEKCIIRAEFILNSLTDGRATGIAASDSPAADYVKQAAAFQTDELLRADIALAKSESGSSSDSSSTQSDERVTIGDFTYSSGSSSSSSNKSSSSSSEGDNTATSHALTVVRLLRAAGCLYCGAEVR